ncbi:uncharacterized protein LOC105190697 [Harpegnathos saltator]|uniref:uncharacterized protein LOC105190697 n=1 Tax=Harpegnathos saltator TaxID=610380 RepID=UPI00058D996F|nr:uncharacterized protein LOC105190697 [Harpegnathos saltator]
MERDSMEREKKERLAKELESQMMKQQLIGMGIYEGTETYEQMKDLLGFLNNSETTLNVATDNKHTRKKDNEQHSDNECLSEMRSETDASQEQMVVTQDLPKVTYKPSHTLPTVVQQERKSSRHSSSPESSPLSTNSTIFDVRSSVQRCKSTENDEAVTTTTLEKHEQTGTNRPVLSKPGNSTQECQNSSPDTKTREMQCAMQSTYYQQLERWRMNPFDVCINENDVPLQQPRSRLAARKCAPSSGCHNKTYTSEQHDQKMRALGQHLREMADLWYSWQRPANAKFEWGVPIEVGTANGSLDRKPVTEPKTELIKAEYTYRDSYERSSKRKANSLIARECASLNKDSSSDEDDQYEFARIKKKKTQSDDKSSNVADHANQQHARAGGKREAAMSIARNSHDDDNSNDDEDIKSPHGRKIENEKNERLSPVLTAYPKRTIPPTPKARANLYRMRRGGAVSKLSLKLQRNDKNEEMERIKNQKKDNVMTDEEIRHKLEEDEEEEEEEVVAILRKDVETRSSKEAKSRLQERRLLSSNAERLGDMPTGGKERNNKQQGNKEKADLDEQRKNEDKFSKLENKNVSWEHHLLDDDEMDQEPASQNGNRHEKIAVSTNNISCPICNKPFPPDKIENHAADCDQFEINDEENADDTNLLTCNICDNYKTTDGVEYQQHVRRCIDNKKDKRHLHRSDDVDIVSITSSHRTYKPSNQKTASSSPETNMDQLPSHSRTRVFTSKKRKH